MKRRELTRLIRTESDIEMAGAWMKAMVRKGLAAGPVLLSLGRERRNKDQNAKLWPMLADVSRQVQMCINGEMVWAEPEDWKDVLTASLKREQRVARGIDGGVVFLGMRTSRMNKVLFGQLIELIYAFGAEYGVEWSEQSKEKFQEMGRAA